MSVGTWIAVGIVLLIMASILITTIIGIIYTNKKDR